MIKLIKLLIIGNILYLLYDLWINQYAFLSALLQKFDLHNIVYYIIYDISPFGSHLWFIWALIYCYILFYILAKFSINPRKLYKFIPILLFALLFMAEFSKVIGITFPLEYYRNFLFMGLPFFTLGYFIRDRKGTLVKLSDLSLVIFAALGFIFTIIEVIIAGKSDIFLGTIIFSVSVLLWCVKNPDKLNFKVTEFIGGKLYTSMYILHVLVLMILIQVIPYLLFVSCFVVTAMLSAVIYIITSRLGINL